MSGTTWRRDFLNHREGPVWRACEDMFSVFVRLGKPCKYGHPRRKNGVPFSLVEDAKGAQIETLLNVLVISNIENGIVQCVETEVKMEL